MDDGAARFEVPIVNDVCAPEMHHQGTRAERHPGVRAGGDDRTRALLHGDDVHEAEAQTKRRRLTRGERGGNNRRRGSTPQPAPRNAHSPTPCRTCTLAPRTRPSTAAHADPHPAPCAPYLAPCAPHPHLAPCAPHSAPCAPHLAPCAPHPHLAPCAPHLAPCAPHSAPCAPLTYDEVITAPVAIDRRFTHRGLAGDVAAAQLIPQLGGIVFYDT